MTIDYRVGDIIDGRVTGIQPYGVFVLLDAHQQGLIHISECQHGYVERLSDHFKVGSTIQVMVLDIDEYSKKNQPIRARVVAGATHGRRTAAQALLDQPAGSHRVYPDCGPAARLGGKSTQRTGLRTRASLRGACFDFHPNVQT